MIRFELSSHNFNFCCDEQILTLSLPAIPFFFLFDRFSLYQICPEGYAQPKSCVQFEVNERVNRVSLVSFAWNV